MVDSKGCALIVVDMQNDFLSRDGYYARRQRFERLVRRKKLTATDMEKRLRVPAMRPTEPFKPRAAHLRRIIDNVCHVIALSRKHHMPIAYLKAVYDRKFSSLPSFLVENPARNHYPCKPNTWGAELIEPVKKLIRAPQANSREQLFEKHTFNGFFKTDLIRFLKKWRIHTVVIAGVETHICVLATAQGASYRQLKTIILKDCVASARRDLAIPALEIFSDGFGTVKRRAETFSDLNQ